MITPADIVTYDPSKVRANRPRRYVRVRMFDHGTLATWRCRLCLALGGYWPVDVAHTIATKHAQECEAIRIAMERDRLAREVQLLRVANARLTAHADIAQRQKGDTQEMARTRASGEENTVEQGCPCTCHVDPGFPLWDSHRCLCKRST